MDIDSTPFKNGYWVWDEQNNELLFVSREASPRTPSVTNVNAPAAKSTAKQPTNVMKFRETVGNLEQIRFRRNYQRHCKPTEPEVITIQDIKDVALFMASIKDLTPEFIRYFHIPTMDRFLRALIIYFQYYIQVWENMLLRREEAKRKLHQPLVTKLENVVRDDLADLRAMVAREYCSILIGAEDARTFHHMNNQNNDSLSDKDRRLFEMLICMAVRVVWIALQRKNLSLIELEMNRLLRTDIFNIVTHRGLRGGADLDRTPAEDRVLTGLANTEERKLLHRSPCAKELILGDHDYRMLIIGIKQFAPTDKRLSHLEAAFSAPEEYLLEMGVTVGMLGIPRRCYDAMLMNIQRATMRRYSSVPRVLPHFKLPTQMGSGDVELGIELPKYPPNYFETSQTVRARRTQCKMWLETVQKASWRKASLLDLSISQSYTVLLTSRSSVSVPSRKDTTTVPHVVP